MTPCNKKKKRKYLTIKVILEQNKHYSSKTTSIKKHISLDLINWFDKKEHKMNLFKISFQIFIKSIPRVTSEYHASWLVTVWIDIKEKKK